MKLYMVDVWVERGGGGSLTLIVNVLAKGVFLKVR